jgi:hypothetical protein
VTSGRAPELRKPLTTREKSQQLQTIGITIAVSTPFKPIARPENAPAMNRSRQSNSERDRMRKWQTLQTDRSGAVHRQSRDPLGSGPVVWGRSIIGSRCGGDPLHEIRGERQIPCSHDLP